MSERNELKNSRAIKNQVESDSVRQIHESVARQDKENLLNIFSKIHVADIADILEQVRKSERSKIVKLWGSNINGKVLTELTNRIRDELLAEIPYEFLAGGLKCLETDELVCLIEDLSDFQQKRVLGLLGKVTQVAVERLLGYEEDTAGRLMQLEVVTAPKHWTVGETIDFLRLNIDITGNYYEIIVVDPLICPIGVIPLSVLLSVSRETSLVDVMKKEFTVIHIDETREKIAYSFNQ